MIASTHQLTKDAYVCLAEDQLVFSNLRDDKYRCLNQANTQAALRLFPSFHGQDKTLLSEMHAVDDEQAHLVVRALADKGLLADEATAGKAVAPIRVPVPTTSLPSDESAPCPHYHLGHLALFFLSSLKASEKLRLQSLRRTVRDVENRRRNNSSSEDDDSLRELVAIFQHLRPYYFREYLCRFDSLALVEFLAHYNQFPQWVFGVRSRPFAAHCWVQENDCVLNDSIDYISQFTPIMAF